jgi:hypothetical protein
MWSSRTLSDVIKRQLLDSRFARNGQTLNGLCESQAITQQTVTKNPAILKEANDWESKEYPNRKRILSQYRRVIPHNDGALISQITGRYSLFQFKSIDRLPPRISSPARCLGSLAKT